MLFCQHKYNTWDTMGSDWLNIEDTPHYKHLRGGNEYREYLKNAWEGRGRDIDQKIEDFEKLVFDIKQNGIKEPVEVVERFNGGRLVFHGNHRYAVARHLGMDFPVNEISIEDYIKFNIENGLRFGTDKKGVPYQSLWYRGKNLFKGRRTDQMIRHSMIEKCDLVGKRVYDFGCNIGAASTLAHESGAVVEGWDLPKFRTSAIRFAVLMNYDIKYQEPEGEYDTLFLFSVHAHTEIPDIAAKVIYLETHEDGKLPDRFKKSKKVGQLGKRSLWRFES